MLTRIFAFIACTMISTAAIAQTTAAPSRSVDLTVPAEIGDADLQRISQNVNRFFRIPSISVGGQVMTPIGGGGLVINVGRSGAAPAQARSIDLSQFANRSVDDYARDIFKDIACSAAAAAAAAACSGSGPVLAACLAIVEAARQACMR